MIDKFYFTMCLIGLILSNLFVGYSIGYDEVKRKYKKGVKHNEKL